MLNKEKLEQLIAILGELTDEQKAIVNEALEKRIPDKELFEKLGGVDEDKFAEFMKAVAAQTEDAVLGQELSTDEMEEAAGGYCRGGASEGDRWNCVQMARRYIYAHKFPNCAATVENGSLCSSNDACYQTAVDYIDMKDCSKAWK